MGRLATAIGGFFRRFGVVALALVVVVGLIVVGVVVATGGGSKAKHVTAFFPKTVGLYTGNDVRILGVKVGRVDSITPNGSQVKVVMSYDGDDQVPATAKAVIIAPSIVSDRYVQLSPAFKPGDAPMPDNHVIQVQDTRVPLELDEIFGSLDNLNKALGPKGANKNGALSKLIETGAANLKGNGTQFNRAFREFSKAVTTLSGSKDDLFSTITHLQSFTTTLAQNDGGIRTLNANLAQVGGQLAGERKDLGAALANLATALSSVNQFVSANRQALTGDIHGLAKVTKVLVKEKEAITQFTDLAPLALSDLGLTYDPQAQTLDTKSDTAEPITAGGPSGAVCQLFHTLGLDLLLDLVTGCGTSNSVATTDPAGTTTGGTNPVVPVTPPSTPATGGTSSKHPTSLGDLLGVTK
jgi:phospholipid/cholesterol/gamma-HCH transport system substrate-binding protein